MNSLKAFLRLPSTGEFLRWTLPALLLALTLRLILMVEMPMAFYHDDTPDFLSTTDRLLHHGKFELNAKKTFLVPIVFTLAFLLPVPALISIAAFQHLLGLGVVLMVGLLCRLWFAHWKWFILPLTILTAINPFLLWYEHTLMAETIFVFCILLVTVAGTLYALEPSRARFIFLGTALFFAAGARPEGKLLFGFGLFLLVLLHWRQARLYLPRFGLMLALAIGVHLITKTSQAGLLLYTSVARFTPSELKIAPGFDPYIAPLRTDLQNRWKEKPSFPKVRDRRLVAAAVETYIKDQESRPNRKMTNHAGMNQFCLKLAIATCMQNLSYLPIHAYHKFRMVSNEAPSGSFDEAWLLRKQRGSLVSSVPQMESYGKGLTGSTLHGEAEINQFVDAHYRPIDWYNRLQTTWLAAFNRFRFPDTKFQQSESPWPFIYWGVPYYFLLAAIGLIVIGFRRGLLQPFHIAWGLTLLGFFFVIMLTGNVRSRFRFAFEPFWIIYIGLLLDFAVSLFKRPSTP